MREIVPLPTVTSLVVFKNTVGSKSLRALLNMHLFNKYFCYEIYCQHCSSSEKDQFENVILLGWHHFYFNNISPDIYDHSVEARNLSHIHAITCIM